MEKTKDKYDIFNEWMYSNGLIMPNIEYPAKFNGGLIGCRARKDIQHRETIMAIPYKLVITLKMVREHPAFGHIIRKFPTIFDEKINADAENLMLTIFLVYES